MLWIILVHFSESKARWKKKTGIHGILILLYQEPSMDKTFRFIKKKLLLLCYYIAFITYKWTFEFFGIHPKLSSSIPNYPKIKILKKNCITFISFLFKISMKNFCLLRILFFGNYHWNNNNVVFNVLMVIISFCII